MHCFKEGDACSASSHSIQGRRIHTGHVKQGVRELNSIPCPGEGQCCGQASILKEQAVPALVKVLDGGPVSAGTAASVWALMEICMRNPAGQEQLLEHDGLAKVRH